MEDGDEDFEDLWDFDQDFNFEDDFYRIANNWGLMLTPSKTVNVECVHTVYFVELGGYLIQDLKTRQHETVTGLP